MTKNKFSPLLALAHDLVNFCETLSRLSSITLIRETKAASISFLYLPFPLSHGTRIDCSDEDENTADSDETDC
jgi:hypothetical protein